MAWIRVIREMSLVDKVDIETLQHHAFPYAGILDINLITGYFAFVNRLADGLGVELESFWRPAPVDKEANSTTSNEERLSDS